MFKLRAKMNFYDKENPGRLVHPGELLVTKDKSRAENLERLGFATIVEREEENKDNGDAMLTVADVEYPLSKVKTALSEIGVKVASNAGVKAVSEKFSALTDEELSNLKSKLSE